MSFNSHAPDDATIEHRVMSYLVELGRDANTYVRALRAYANTRAILARRPRGAAPGGRARGRADSG